MKMEEESLLFRADSFPQKVCVGRFKETNMAERGKLLKAGQTYRAGDVKERLARTRVYK